MTRPTPQDSRYRNPIPEMAVGAALIIAGGIFAAAVIYWINKLPGLLGGR